MLHYYHEGALTFATTLIPLIETESERERKRERETDRSYTQSFNMQHYYHEGALTFATILTL